MQENKDWIEQIDNLSSEEIETTEMENLWQKLKEKRKENSIKYALPYWKKMGAVAAILLPLFLISLFITLQSKPSNDNSIEKEAVLPKIINYEQKKDKQKNIEVPSDLVINNPISKEVTKVSDENQLVEVVKKPTNQLPIEKKVSDVFINEILKMPQIGDTGKLIATNSLENNMATQKKLKIIHLNELQDVPPRSKTASTFRIVVNKIVKTATAGNQ